MSCAGLQPLLSEEATIKDQVKAARAAEFDHKVQSGLGEVEPEPDAADIKTAAPAAPTAAKVGSAFNMNFSVTCFVPNICFGRCS